MASKESGRDAEASGLWNVSTSVPNSCAAIKRAGKCAKWTVATCFRFRRLISDARVSTRAPFPEVSASEEGLGHCKSLW